MLGFFGIGAQEKTRTSTAVRPLAPEASVSTNFTTWACRFNIICYAEARRQAVQRCRVDGANDTQQAKCCKPLFAKKYLLGNKVHETAFRGSIGVYDEKD